MMENTIKINGNTIGHLYLHNEGMVSNGMHQYFYRYYNVRDGVIISGYVKHYQKDQAETLQKLIFQDICKKQKKQNT